MPRTRQTRRGRRRATGGNRPTHVLKMVYNAPADEQGNQKSSSWVRVGALWDQGDGSFNFKLGVGVQP